jgi:hypothetical protein
MKPFAFTLLLLAAPVLAISFPPRTSASKPKDAKKSPPAEVVITAEVVCMHCEFGLGESCAGALKIDKNTPVALVGKAAEPLKKIRFDHKVAVVQGTLSLDKNKRLSLAVKSAHLWTDKDKGKAPAQGMARVVGQACCGQCDLGLCDTCTAAVRNAKFPIILDGKLAVRHLEEGDKVPMTALGKLFIDKRGLVRLEAKKVTFSKKAK